MRTDHRFSAKLMLSSVLVLITLALTNGAACAAAAPGAGAPLETASIAAPDPGAEELRIVAAIDWCAPSLEEPSSPEEAASGPNESLCVAVMTLISWAAPAARPPVEDAAVWSLDGSGGAALSRMD